MKMPNLGLPAHWKYKEKGPHDEEYEQRINWLKETDGMASGS